MPIKAANTVRVVCISDTHGRHEAVDVPAGDILCFAGDMLLINRYENLSILFKTRIDSYHLHAFWFNARHNALKTDRIPNAQAFLAYCWSTTSPRL